MYVCMKLMILDQYTVNAHFGDIVLFMYIYVYLSICYDNVNVYQLLQVAVTNKT